MKTLDDVSTMRTLTTLAALLLFLAPHAEAQVDPFQGDAIPEEAVSELREAREQRRAGEYKAAIERLTTLVEQHPDYYLAWYNLGLADAQANDPEAASKALQRALELKESLDLPDPTIYNSTGWSHYLRGDYAAAKELLERAVEQEGLSENSRRKALNNLGSVLLRLQDYEKAEEYFEKASHLGSSRAKVNLRVLDVSRSVKMQQKAALKEKGSGG